MTSCTTEISIWITNATTLAITATGVPPLLTASGPPARFMMAIQITVMSSQIIT